MTQEERIARITYMEQLFDRCCEAQTQLETALASFEETAPLFKQLADYYFDGGLWAEDYAADEAGLLPAALKRGVLAQDALWNLFEQQKQLQNELQQLTAETNEK
ncbi:MAG: DUF4298 domain-containing protein [Oscillospiraceae bacterium]|nr:DUF4298 domain-containing protein [Oscillospiraceae bacterium]